MKTSKTWSVLKKAYKKQTKNQKPEVERAEIHNDSVRFSFSLSCNSLTECFALVFLMTNKCALWALILFGYLVLSCIGLEGTR